MPKRENEFWAGMKEPKGRGLCPFCGSSNISYNQKFRSWRCNKCEHSFPSPSYGPGREFGKEARWFGKTTNGIRQEGFAEAARQARAAKWKESGRSDSGYPFDPGHVGHYKMEYPTRSKRSGLRGCLKSDIIIFILVVLGTVVWRLWGGQIAEFYGEVTYQQPPYSKASGQQVHLVNNKDATDPTWQELVSFLRLDDTDKDSYSLGIRVCADFAEEVHNNAEAAGIKAAFVSIDFEGNSEKHALDAFHTLDEGLVFIDCTGQQPNFIVPLVPVGGKTFGDVESWDKMAYVVVGKEYGLISLGVAASAQYSFYEAYLAKRENYESKLGAYNQEVDAYNQALGGRVHLYEPEYSRFMEWYNRLNSMEAELEATLEELGDFYWESLGVVSKIEIYW